MALKFELSIGGSSVIVALNSPDPNEPAPIQYSGDADAIAEVKDWLSRQSGAFGHMVSETATNPIDLHYALSTDEAKRWFEAKLVEGSAPSYNPQIPPGAMT